MGFDEPHGGTWHGGYVGRGWVLHNGVATAVVDGFETLGTVFVGTSEYYAQALLSPRFGSRGQGVVYGWGQNSCGASMEREKVPSNSTKRW